MTSSTLSWDNLRRFLEGPDWRVIHVDGRAESFDGQRLVESLVHAGVPVVQAITFYRDFLERGARRLNGDQIRLSDVTSLITNLLMESGEPLRASWVRNYDNLYGFEQEFPIDPVGHPGFIDPADGGRLERELRGLVRKQLGPVPELPGAVSREAIDEAVGRIVTVVRLCEFERIPRDFLTVLVATLAEHSSDLVLPGASADSADRQRPLQLADDLLGAAALHANSPAHRKSVSTLLILATSPAATHFLQYYGFMPRTGPGTVLRQLHRVLEAGAGHAAKPGVAANRTAPAAAYQRLAEELGPYGIRPKHLLDASGELIKALGLETDSTPRVETPLSFAAGDSALVERARQFIGLIRIATDSSLELRDVRDAFSTRPLGQPAVQAALLSAFRNLGMSCTGHFQTGRGIVTAQMNVRSKIGEYAQEIAILVSDSPIQDLDADISRLVEFVAGPPARAGFLGSTALDPADGEPSPKLGKDQFEVLAELARRGSVVVPIGTMRLLRALANGSLLLDTLADALVGTYPQLRTT